MFCVTIDGKAGCGKSSLAQELSKQTGLKNFNTGAVYRGITCQYFKQYGETPPNQKIVDEFVKTLDVKVDFKDGTQNVVVNGTNFTPFLREEKVNNFVALVSPYDEIREKVRQIQREFAKNNECIMEGRDIGRVVLPFAPCKLFVTASNEVRAQRRYEQLKNTPDCPTVEQLIKEQEERDFKDINREHGALIPAEDAIVIDNSTETLEQTTQRCVGIINKIKASQKN